MNAIELTAEERLLRKGNLINTIGILRAMKLYNGKLEKDAFIQLVRKTYTISDDYFNDVIVKSIEEIWHNAKNKLIKLNILDTEKSTDTTYFFKKKNRQNSEI